MIRANDLGAFELFREAVIDVEESCAVLNRPMQQRQLFIDRARKAAALFPAPARGDRGNRQLAPTDVNRLARIVKVVQTHFDTVRTLDRGTENVGNALRRNRDT